MRSDFTRLSIFPVNNSSLFNLYRLFQSPIYVAIPFTISRASGHSREAFVKADIQGEWREIPSTEVTYDNHKVYIQRFPFLFLFKFHSLPFIP